MLGDYDEMLHHILQVGGWQPRTLRAGEHYATADLHPMPLPGCARRAGERLRSLPHLRLHRRNGLRDRHRGIVPGQALPRRVGEHPCHPHRDRQRSPSSTTPGITATVRASCGWGRRCGDSADALGAGQLPIARSQSRPGASAHASHRSRWPAREDQDWTRPGVAAILKQGRNAPILVIDPP